MRLTRVALGAAAILGGVAAWPQDPLLPAVDHSQHPLFEHPAGEPVPFMRVHMHADLMDGFNLFLETRDFRFTPERVDTANVANEGHAHLYLNGQKVARMYSPWHHVPRASLRDGINRLEVEFSTNDHSTWAVAGQPIGADILLDSRVADGDPIVRSQVGYTLDWEWGRARQSKAGGWSTITDLGYHVHVTSGGVVTRNLELVPCHVPVPGRRASLLPALLTLPTAMAGHSSLVPNESKISKSYTEDLARPQSMFLEARVVTDPEYCSAHYLVARGKGTAPGAPALWLSGTWGRAAGSRGAPFELRSAGAYGEFRALGDAEGPLERRSIVGGIEVTVTRALGTLLDGIDFAAGLDEGHGFQVMRRLVSKTEVRVDGR
ncbi:MAG: hypothetical protein OXN89_20015 [Bryobacterales bacterium]|nr:hypothetical protein [Bryobacterales bacterium]